MNVISAGINCCCCDLWLDKFDSNYLFSKRWESYHVTTGIVTVGDWTISSGKAVTNLPQKALHLHPNYIDSDLLLFGTVIGVKYPKIWKFSCIYDCGDGGVLAFDKYGGVPSQKYIDPLSPEPQHPRSAIVFSSGKAYYGWASINDGFDSDSTPDTNTFERFQVADGLTRPYEIEVIAYSGSLSPFIDGLFRVKINGQWVFGRNLVNFDYLGPVAGRTGINPSFFSLTTNNLEVSEPHWSGYDYEAKPDCKCANQELNECWGNHWPWRKAPEMTVEFPGLEVTPTPIPIMCDSFNRNIPPFGGFPALCHSYVCGYDIWYRDFNDFGMHLSRDWIYPGGASVTPAADSLIPVSLFQCTDFNNTEDTADDTLFDNYEYTDYKPLFPQAGTYLLTRVEDAIPNDYDHYEERWAAELDLGDGINKIEVVGKAHGFSLNFYKPPFIAPYISMPLGGEFMLPPGKYNAFGLAPLDPFNRIRQFKRVPFPTIEGPWDTEVHLGYVTNFPTIGEPGSVYYKLAGNVTLTPTYE